MYESAFIFFIWGQKFVKFFVGKRIYSEISWLLQRYEILKQCLSKVRRNETATSEMYLTRNLWRVLTPSKIDSRRSDYCRIQVHSCRRPWILFKMWIYLLANYWWWSSFEKLLQCEFTSFLKLRQHCGIAS